MRRRNRRHASRGVRPWVWIVTVGVMLVAGGLVLQSSGLLPEFKLSSNGSVGELNSSRFSGSKGVEIPASTPPDWWWTRIVVDQDVKAPGSAELADGERYSRVLIPTDVLFGRDSATISERAMDALRDVAATITSPEIDVIVVCHSSRDGATVDRKPLSERRAEEVASALETLLQRPQNSIERIGMGDEQPLPGIDQTTKSGLALNRRCEVFIGLGEQG